MPFTVIMGRVLEYRKKSKTFAISERTAMKEIIVKAIFFIELLNKAADEAVRDNLEITVKYRFSYHTVKIDAQGVKTN
jgi:hypothetical protein